MRKTIFIYVALFFLSINSALATHHEGSAHGSASQIEIGKKLFNNNCASCHGANLQGADNWKSLDEDGHRKAPPLNGTGHAWHHSDEQLYQIIKYGLAKFVKNYQGKMMGFSDILSDTEITSVLAYMKSTWPKDILEKNHLMNK
jgi:mono/diheme cytochrome c family protein